MANGPQPVLPSPATRPTAAPVTVLPAEPPRPVSEVAAAPTPTEAEIWAELSTPEHVAHTHDEELRWRHRLRDLHILHPTRPTSTLMEAR